MKKPWFVECSRGSIVYNVNRGSQHFYTFLKRLIQVLKIVCALSLMLLWNVCFAKEIASSTQTLREKLTAVKTMAASFTQVVYAKNHSLSRSSGTMALWRPGRFRWQTNTPMKQLVIADGSRLWVYDVELEQVTVKNQTKEQNGMAALFLSGDNETVSRDFDVMLSRQGQQERFVLRAKSNKSMFQQVVLLFTKNKLQHIQLFDQLGQRTEVGLTNIKINPMLAVSLFTFKAPKGVDVVRQ